jgi:hypothetical protein
VIGGRTTRVPLPDAPSRGSREGGIAASARTSAITIVISFVCSGCFVMWHGRDPDRSEQVVVYEILDHQRVAVDERYHPEFDAVAFQELVIRGERVVYPARDGDRWRIVDGGVPGRSWRGIGEVVMSASGAHLAYAAEDDDERWHVVSDGWIGPAFDAIHARTIAYGPNERALVYVASSSEGAHVVVNGRVGPAYDGVGRVRFGDRGRRLAYVAREGHRMRVVVDGRAEAAYDDIPELVLAPRGPGYAYVGIKDGGFVLVRDGALATGVEDEIVALQLSADGSRAACVVRSGEREAVLADGARGAWHERVDGSSLVLYGRHTAYIARDGDERRVIVDEVAGPAYREIDGPRASEALHGYVGRGPGRSVVHIGERTIEHDVWAGNLVLPPRGDRFAYLLRDGDRTAIVTDRERRTFDAVIVSSLVFDELGERWGVVAIDRAAQRLFVATERGERPFELDALSALAVADTATTRADFDSIEIVRRWIRRALSEEAGSDE